MGLRIENISRPAIKKKAKRKGRGIGSGRGKTSGKGHKGAKSRSGGGVYNPGFEGGQMPLIRKMPKRGFTNKFKKEWCIINTGILERSGNVSDGATINNSFLSEKGFLKKKGMPVKVLAKGSLKKALTVEANAFSASAIKIIEDAGGKARVVPLRSVIRSKKNDVQKES